MDRDLVALARAQPHAFDFGRDFARFLPLDLEPGRMDRLAVQADVDQFAAFEVDVQGAHRRILGGILKCGVGPGRVLPARTAARRARANAHLAHPAAARDGDRAPQAHRTAHASPTKTPVPTPVPTTAPTADAQTHARPARVSLIGLSWEGRPINAYALGTGAMPVAIVGGMHGAPEANSSWLVWELLDYYESTPAAIPPDLSLLFVPEANPDGLANGMRELADGVDPNRNWPTPTGRPTSYGPAGACSTAAADRRLCPSPKPAAWPRGS